MKAKVFLITGAAFMALAVGFGAFGAHIVEGFLPAERFQVYQTAVQYHFYHSLGVLIVGALSLFLERSVWLHRAGYFLIFGIIVFSGSLYTLTLTDTPWLGAVTPVGGIAFILGWIFIAIACLTSEKIKH